MSWMAMGLWCLTAASAQTARPLDFSQASWIGSPVPAQRVAFERGFVLPAAPLTAQLLMTADPSYQVTVNGATVGGGTDWGQPQRFDVTRLLRAGENTVAATVPRGEAGRGSLLAALRAVTGDGTVVELRTDKQWRAGEAGAAASALQPAAEIGAYGSQPYGRLTRMSMVEALAAMADVRLTVPAEGQSASTFQGSYTRPELADRYRSYVTVDRGNGRFRVAGTPKAMLFVRYSQPGGGYDAPCVRPQDFDFDLFASDLKTLSANGLQIALGGFGWRDLLAADGTWLKLARQPKGAGLPLFRYAYEVVDYALDRVQEQGLSAVVLLDLRQALPAGAVPEPYADKMLLAPQLWDAVVRGQAKIAGYFGERPVIAGWCLAADGLPVWPQRAEPLLTQAYREYLTGKYGGIDGVKRAWNGAAPAAMDSVALPAEGATDQAACDLVAMREAVTVARLNGLADALRGAAPHHLLAFGDPDPSTALAEPQRLRFDIYGTFGMAPAPLDPAGELAPPSPAAWALARSVRALPRASLAGTLSGRYGAGSIGARAGRAVLHEWAESVTDGAAGCITAPTWDRLTGRGPGTQSMPELPAVSRLATAVEALQKPFMAYPPRVLVVRGQGLPAATEQTSAARLAETLERLHVPYDVLAPSAVGGLEEAFHADLGRYRMVIIPAIRRLPDDGFWTAVDRWLGESGTAERTLLVGRVATAGPLSPVAAKVIAGWAAGGDAAVDAGAFSVKQPIAALPAGRLLAWPSAQLPVVDVPSEGGTVIGTMQGHGTERPVLVARRSAAGHRLVAAGFDLGLGEVPVINAALWDTLTYLGRGLLESTDIVTPIQSPGALTVRLSEDGGTAVAIERGGDSPDVLWTTGASRPESVWAGAETRFAGDGTVSVAAPIAPYQVKLFEAVGEVHGLDADERAKVQANQPTGEGLSVTAQGPDGMMVRLRTIPSGNFTVRQANGTPQTERADEEGNAEATLDAGKPVTMQLYGAVAPPTQVVTAADYVSLADYYVQRRDIDRAFGELARLSASYPGTEVAKLADLRADALRKRCGAVVLVNCTDQPVMANYAGMQLSSGVVEPGRERRFLLWAGGYREEIRDIYGYLAQGEERSNMIVTAGQVDVREWAGEAGATAVKLLRSRLAPEERQTLASTTQQQLGLAQAQAEGGAGTGTAKPGQGAEPPLAGAITVDYDLVKSLPTKAAGVSRFTVRNRTSRKALLMIRHRALPPNPVTLEEVPVDPKRTAATEADLEGTYDLWIHFPDSGQDLTIGEHKADGSVFVVTVGEYTPQQMERRKLDKRRRASGTTRTKRTVPTPSSESSSFGGQSPFGGTSLGGK
ncbi:MAG: hypothetical protein HZB16_24445 [Armatimonadetes bacterium]|nr:hypothetical protein [Armatimonadota bacterium]